MVRIPRLVIFLSLLVFSRCSFAAIIWVVGGASTTFTSFDAAKTWMTNTDGCGYAHYGSLYTGAVTSTTATSTGYNVGVQEKGGSTVIANCSYTATLRCNGTNSSGNLAGTPPSCTCPSGQAWRASDGVCFVATCNVSSGSIKRFSGSGATPPSTFCGDDMCNYSVKGIAVGLGTVSTWSGTYASAGTACVPPSGAPTPADDSDGCISASGGGVTACIQKKGCGTVNGAPVCVGTLPSDTCVTTAAGLTVCGKTASTVSALTPVATPPAPDTGTPGVAATPAATITTEGTGAASGGQSGPSQTSVFTPGQGAASTVAAPGGSTSNNSGTGAPGTADHVIVDAGPAGTGSSDCSTSGTCTNATGGTGSSAPSDAQDFSASTDSFYSSVSSSPIGSAMSSVGSGFPTGGTVPSASFDAFGRTFTLTPPQAVVDAITPVLIWIMRAVWSWIALRRFMEA